MKTRNLKSKAVVGQVGIHALLKKILLFIFLLVGIHANAQTIELSGNIEDAFLKTPLDDVKVSLLTMDSIVLVKEADLIRYKISDNQLLYVCYRIPVKAEKKSYLLHAELPGYTEAWEKIDIVDTSLKKMSAPTLKLRKSMERTLGTATVVATQIKMCYKGDTLVYNANAFKLPDGSMLDALINQLPGVKLNEHGEIFVNGRKVDELLLGSHSFMRGNTKVLMENLPYYTVKDIKVYDKRTDESEALGYDIAPRRFVMDVNLKNEYNRGYIANVEAAGGTDHRWLGRGFLLGFTDLFRVSLYANLNNVNESRHIGQSGYWTPAFAPRSLLTTRSTKGEINYYGPNKKIENSLYGSYSSTTDDFLMKERREQFLNNRTPTSISENGSHASNRKVSVSNGFKLKKPFYISFDTSFDYVDFDATSHALMDLWDDSLITSQRNRGIKEGRKYYLHNGFNTIFNLNKEKEQSLSIGAFVNYEDNQSQSVNKYHTHYISQENKVLQYNSNDVTYKDVRGQGGMTYRQKFRKDYEICINNDIYWFNEKKKDYLYHPDTLLLPSQMDMLNAITDFSNSYSSHHKHINDVLSFSLTKEAHLNAGFMSINYNKWKFNANIYPFHSSLRYQRGLLDTLIHQNTLLYDVSIDLKEYSKKGTYQLKYGAKFNSSVASIYDLVNYRDDSQPLVIKLGNPHLKAPQNTTAYADLSLHSRKNMQQFRVKITLDYHHRDVAQSTSYNPENGVYTFRPENVHGNYLVKGKLDYSRALDKKKFWTLQTSLNADFNHNVDYSLLEGETQSYENVVNNLSLKENAYVQYQRKGMTLRATADFSWRHSEGKMRDFETLDAFDFQYGVNGSYTIPVIKTTIALDGNMYSRRGYGSSALNTDDFVLNASLSQSFLKGKLIARLEGFDLLHQISSTQYAVNAQGRTETWYRSLPRYVMFHLVYHWNKNPKKR